MKSPKPATVAELIAVIAEFNKAHELLIREGKLAAGKENPLFDALYQCATTAAKSLLPHLNVAVKTIPATTT